MVPDRRKPIRFRIAKEHHNTDAGLDAEGSVFVPGGGRENRGYLRGGDRIESLCVTWTSRSLSSI